MGVYTSFVGCCLCVVFASLCVDVYCRVHNIEESRSKQKCEDCYSVRRPVCGVSLFPWELCGENLCKCCGHNEQNESPIMADCTSPKQPFPYIPKLPESVHSVNLWNNTLASCDMSQSFFSNITQVKYLRLVNNKITRLDPTMFGRMKNLKCLRVDLNPITHDSVKSLLSLPGLQCFSAEGCGMPSPEPDFYNNITSNVTHFSLIINQLHSTYDISAFHFLPNLRWLDLSYCGINTVSISTVLLLDTLSLQKNALSYFPTTCNDHKESFFPNLRTLFLGENQIVLMRNTCLPKLEHLDLSENFIASMTGYMFDVAALPKLEQINLASQRASSISIGINAFQNPSLKHIRLEKNQLQFDQEGVIDYRAFQNCPNLRRLDLNGNRFEQVDDQRFLKLFGHLRLTDLVMYDNQLYSIALTTFAHFQNITNLLLAGTELDTVPAGALDSCTKLETLDLSDNKITDVTEHTFSKETRQRLSALRLSGNPFMCSCELMWFRDWLVSKPRLFSDSKTSGMGYTCQNLPGTNLKDFDMIQQACLLSAEMSVQIVVSCSILIITLIVVSAIFRFRWHIRLAFYEAFRARGAARRLRFLNNYFDYDVFVSYACEDLPWVHEHLMPELEGRQGLRLCVHERDFIPGKNIVDNIVECVESSKKILMVFSKDFLRSQWCQFELTLCLNYVMDRDDSLLIVCVDDVMAREMTPAMMAVLKTTTYIQWEENVDAVDSFWGRLGLALQEIAANPVVPARPVDIDEHAV